MKNVPKKQRPSVEDQLALMKLAGWRLEYAGDRWYVRVPEEYSPILARHRESVLLNDPNKNQAISRAFGYFMQGIL